MSEQQKKAGFLGLCAATIRETPPKKLALAAGLLIVIVVAAVFFVKKSGFVSAKVTPPAIVLDQPLTMIEMKAPYKQVTLTIREWNKLGHDDSGRYKAPDTGEYTMVSPITCAASGETIPDVWYPPAVLAMPPAQCDQEQARLRSEYKCPICGKPAYPH